LKSARRFGLDLVQAKALVERDAAPVRYRPNAGERIVVEAGSAGRGRAAYRTARRFRTKCPPLRILVESRSAVAYDNPSAGIAVP
jgi:hypothetical protein